MNIFLLYMVKTATYIAGFYIVYFFFLSADTHYRRNRVFLLLSLSLSLLMPLATINVREENTMFYLGKTLSEVFVTAERIYATTGTGEPAGNGIMLIIFRTYIIGVIVFGIKLLTDILSLAAMIFRQRDNETRLIRFRGYNTAGFSAMGHIFINQSVSGEEEKEIISHEQNHLEQYHFLDILFLETVKIFQWFNPAIYMMSRSLRAVHEYQADDRCLKSGMTVARYQNLLLCHLLRSKIFISSNSFSNPSLIRKRMIMMSKSRSGTAASLKILLAIPVIFIILAVISAFELNRDTPKRSDSGLAVSPPADITLDVSGPQVFHKPLKVEPAPVPPTLQPVQLSEYNSEALPDQSITLPEVTDNEAVNVPEEVFVVVEEMPQYPGGDKALMEFVYSNIEYPQSAKQRGVQGRVILRFAIMYDGKVDNVTVIRGVDPELDQEAVRVVSMINGWKPGVQGGKPVNVWYSIPITFQLK